MNPTWNSHLTYHTFTSIYYSSKDTEVRGGKSGTVTTDVAIKFPKGMIGRLVIPDTSPFKYYIKSELTPNDWPINICIVNLGDHPLQIPRGSKVATLYFQRTVKMRDLQVEFAPRGEDTDEDEDWSSDGRDF